MKRDKKARENTELTAARLRCEYLVSPPGIHVTWPRMNWIVESSERGQKQTAYRILVAGSEAQLAADKGDLWDSERMDSDETAHIVYARTNLKSRMSCCWKVMVWDVNGTASAWSDPAMWSMGLLRPEDWGAKWLGYAKASDHGTEETDPLRGLTFDNCWWIWFPEVQQRYIGDSEATVPPCTRYFRRSFVLPEDANVEWAGIVLAVYDEFVLYVNGRQAGEGPGRPDGTSGC